MRLTKGFTVGDIIEYEITEDINILEEFRYGNTDIVISCLMLGNKCNLEDACKIFADANKEYELVKIIEVLITEIVGKQVEKTENTEEQKEIKTLSDMLLESYAEIQTYDNRLDFNSFLNMSTKLLWKYAEIVRKIYINNENKRLKDTWEQINMLFGMFTGELKKCPEIGNDKAENTREMLIKKYKEIKGE